MNTNIENIREELQKGVTGLLAGASRMESASAGMSAAIRSLMDEGTTTAVPELESVCTSVVRRETDAAKKVYASIRSLVKRIAAEFGLKPAFKAKKVQGQKVITLTFEALPAEVADESGPTGESAPQGANGETPISDGEAILGAVRSALPSLTDAQIKDLSAMVADELARRMSRKVLPQKEKTAA